MKRKILTESITFNMEGSQDWEKSLINILKYYDMLKSYYTIKLTGLIDGLNEIHYLGKTTYSGQVFNKYEDLLSFVYPEFVWDLEIVQSDMSEYTMNGILYTAPTWLDFKSKTLNVYKINLCMGKSEDWNLVTELNIGNKKNVIDALNQIGYSGKTIYNNINYDNREDFLNKIFENKNIIWNIETIKQDSGDYCETILVSVY